MMISYGIHRTPFGSVVLGLSPRGVCRLAFLDRPTDAAAQRAMRETFPEAELRRDDKSTAPAARAAFGASNGKVPRLDLHGTDFQREVWAAMRRVKAGCVTTYGALAAKIDRPKAVRAVGAACGANPVAVLVPCHRVLAADGSPGGYRWGLARKKALLAAEAAAR